MNGSRIILAAHRGDRFNYPENTMPAFESAVSLGVVRIIGSFGTKIWDDEGIACVIQSSLIQKLVPFDQNIIEIIQAISSEDGQKLILTLQCDLPVSKQNLIEKVNIDVLRLNELLLLFTENRIIEFVADHSPEKRGYIISGHCGIAAYMMLSAMHILNKKHYTVSQYLVR